MSPLVPRLRPFTSTIFAEITQLAVRTGAINLGQGFPDTDGPASLLADAAHAITDGGANQYPPASGVPALREAIAEHQERFYGLSVDPVGEVLVTAGATEAIASAVIALCEPGDEVVVFEPYYDSYPAVIAMAGATRRTVALRAPDFLPDPAELRAAFGPRTKAVLVNTPHNPTGTVFGPDTLRAIGDLAIEHDAVVITDEVYEHMTFGTPHVPMASLSGMAERTLTISSAGKTFSVTGWKIGWIHGPEELVAAVRAVKQFLTFAGGAPFQPAVANALALPDETFAAIAGDLRPKRDLLMAGLREAGMRVFEPQGTYFVVADLAPLGVTDAAAYARAMPERVGVAAVPVSVFCDDPTLAPTLLRFAFCKRDEVLTEALTRL